ncbi:MAG: ABC transporter permease, partial [Candidatus Zixiibacteriota bacterium]
MSVWLQQTYGIRCLGALGFENTYALAVPEKLADSLHLVSIDDLARFAPEMTIASDYEFFSRPEWTTLTETYHLRFRETRTMDHSLMYAAVANGAVQVISAYSTDGWIADYHLRVLTDPRHAFPPYDAVLLVSPNASDDIRLTQLLAGLAGTIDADRMRQANKIVDVDGGTVREAATFLDSIIGAR